MEAVPDPKHDPDERVSLDPLDPETALRALLAVKPEAASDEPETEQGPDPSSGDTPE